MFVKTAPGRLVRCPVKGSLLPEEGAEVPDDAIFWRNRLRDGDVVKVVKKTSVAPPKNAPKNTVKDDKEPEA
ncbi:DUF2635 domain-containing protein [Lelliottia nimipressuralis]|uniref:DUF2635 domain-containing protein n=1 Tax=Lelliottia nimipressuralis TaxID=69220 RepID=UPI003559116E